MAMSPAGVASRAEPSEDTAVMTIRPAPGHSPADPAAASCDTGPDPMLDHLVYATPDLDATIAEFRAATGLEPAPGGRHVGLGTRNVLVGLGPTAYLEIVGPDAGTPPQPGRQMPFGIADLPEPRLTTWAVHPPDIARAAAASARAGADLGPVVSMSRERPDGVRLDWRLATTHPAPLHGVTPFLIDWETSPHPAAGDLPRAGLLSLRGFHPDPRAVTAVLRAIGVRLAVDAGPAGLVAVLDTPAGPVQLS